MRPWASHQTVHILFLANDFAVAKSIDLCEGNKIMKSVWPSNLDFVLDVMTCRPRYYMRDSYIDNNLTDYYSTIFNFVTY